MVRYSRRPTARILPIDNSGFSEYVYWKSKCLQNSESKILKMRNLEDWAENLVSSLLFVWETWRNLFQPISVELMKLKWFINSNRESLAKPRTDLGYNSTPDKDSDLREMSSLEWSKAAMILKWRLSPNYYIWKSANLLEGQRSLGFRRTDSLICWFQVGLSGRADGMDLLISGRDKPITNWRVRRLWTFEFRFWTIVKAEKENQQVVSL